MRATSFVAAVVLAIAAILGGGSAPGARAQTPGPLTCTVSVVNVVGAHAGTLALRVGATASCGEAVSLEFTLPGGAHSTFPSTPTGTFTGIVGEGYVCAGKDDRVAVLATGAGGRSWLGLVTIGPESGPPVPAGTIGRTCDVLLGPGLNYLSWSGPVSRVEDAFAAGRFGAVIPRGTVTSSAGLDQITSVSGYDPVAGVWGTWIPGAPAAANTLRVLKPSLVYVVRSSADIEYRYPPA